MSRNEAWSQAKAAKVFVFYSLPPPFFSSVHNFPCSSPLILVAISKPLSEPNCWMLWSFSALLQCQMSCAVRQAVSASVISGSSVRRCQINSRVKKKLETALISTPRQEALSCRWCFETKKWWSYKLYKVALPDQCDSQAIQCQEALPHQSSTREQKAKELLS